MDSVKEKKLKTKYNFDRDDINYFRNVCLLYDHILKYNYTPFELKYDYKYTYTEIINIVSSFLKSLDLDIYELFKYKLNNNEFNFYTLPYDKIDNKHNYPFFEYHDKPRINIILHNTLEDAYDIVHEFFHSSNFKLDSSKTKFKFAEVPTILSEILLSNYLILNDFKESEKEINNRICSTYSDSLKFLVLDRLLSDNINYEEIILEYPGINLLPEKYEKIISQKDFSYIDSSKYIIATFFAILLNINLKYNDLKNMLVELNKKINTFSDRDLYKFIGLRLNRQGMFNGESLNKLCDSYNKQCEINSSKTYLKRMI